MPNQRVVNFNPQVFQPITQQQSPKSVLAQLLLSRGSRVGNTAGAGIRSAGELIAGALLQKSAFGDQQDKNIARSKAIGELIKSQFPAEVLSQAGTGENVQGITPEQTAQRGAGQDSSGNFLAPTASSEDLNLIGDKFRLVDRENRSPFTPLVPLDRRNPNTKNTANDIANELIGQGGLGPTQFPFDPVQDPRGFSRSIEPQPQPQPQPAGPGINLTQQFPSGTDPAITQPNQLGQLLGGINNSLASQGGLDPSALLKVVTSRQANQAAIAREDFKFNREQAAKKEAASLLATNQRKLKGTLPGVIPKSDITDGKIIVPTADGGFEAKEVVNIGEGAKGQEVKRSDILDDGSAVLVFKDGTTGVRDRAGNLATGADRLKVLQKSLAFSLKKSRLTAGEKQAGSSAIKQSVEMFQKVSDIEQGLGLYDQAIAQLDAGAGTGPVINLLPSVRTASVNLDNIQAQLGLNVIQRTTFGSLSEAELNFALSSALPTKLDNASLRQWLTAKKSAQQKLSNYLQNAAVFLGTPGNTIAKWVAIQQKAQSKRNQDIGKKQSKVGRFTIEEQ